MAGVFTDAEAARALRRTLEDASALPGGAYNADFSAELYTFDVDPGRAGNPEGPADPERPRDPEGPADRVGWLVVLYSYRPTRAEVLGFFGHPEATDVCERLAGRESKPAMYDVRLRHLDADLGDAWSA